MRTRPRLALAPLARPVVALLVACALLAGCGEDVAATATATSPDTDSPTESSDVAEPSPTAVEPDSEAPGPAARTLVVPADFPLADSLPDTNGHDGSPVVVTDEPGLGELVLCGTAAWTRRGTLDVAGVTYLGEAEDSRARTLAVYADPAAARTALERLRDTLTDCPSGSVGGTDQVYAPVQGTQASVTFTHRYRTDGRFDTGLEVIEAVAVGNALYLASYYGEGGGSAGTIASSVAYAAESSSGVIDAMAAFATR